MNQEEQENNMNIMNNNNDPYLGYTILFKEGSTREFKDSVLIELIDSHNHCRPFLFSPVAELTQSVCSRDDDKKTATFSFNNQGE